MNELDKMQRILDGGAIVVVALLIIVPVAALIGFIIFLS